jgi:UDP-N-acetylmuramyl pentapeptide phosphotransferase/UDP-N-acetylglucosamine-1-phosphate transferase
VGRLSARAAGWVLFALFALTVPFPALPPFGGLAPAVHHVFLLAATAAIGLVEGVDGPVKMILVMFAVVAIASLLACAIAAWISAWLLARTSPRARAIAVAALCIAFLGASLAFDLYRTPFGREPVTNLLGVFG